MDGQSALERAPGQVVPKVLVVDDDTSLLGALAELLAGDGYFVATATSAEDALDRCREDTFHLVLCDLQLPGRNGISLLKTLHEACPATALVLVTGHGSIRSAVTALKRGACEYMTKPVKPRRLLALTASLTASAADFLPNSLLAADRAAAVRLDGMIARSRPMRTVFERIRLAAAVDSTALILGESGTGKELVARSIHGRSARARGPFVTLNAAALSPAALGAELFGHDRVSPGGAPERVPGRIEAAENGTLFIDEISVLDELTQVALLRLLETSRYVRVGGRKERGVNVRVIAASNRDLAAMVKVGAFREDLHTRLGIFTIRVPSLKERPEDVQPLTAAFLEEFARKYRKSVTTIPAETERLLVGYPWPGNVRELRNVVEQAVLLAGGTELSPSLLPQMMHHQPPPARSVTIPIGMPMEDIEREIILRTLEAHGGNKTATAEALGISRRSIYNKLAEYEQRGYLANRQLPI